MLMTKGTMLAMMRLNLKGAKKDVRERWPHLKRWDSRPAVDDPARADILRRQGYVRRLKQQIANVEEGKAVG